MCYVSVCEQGCSLEEEEGGGGTGEIGMLTSFPLITRQQSPLIARALRAFDVFKYPAGRSHAAEAWRQREGGKGQNKVGHWMCFEVAFKKKNKKPAE